HLVNGEVEFTPGNTDIAENMTCNAGELFTFDDTNFLMLNKDDDANAVTTYLVSKYNVDDSQVGCNQWLGYTVVTFDGTKGPLFVNQRVLPFVADTNTMMASVVGNMAGHNQDIVRVAETYVHECGHQCGVLHDSTNPDCENATTLHIAKVMDPGGNVR